MANGWINFSGYDGNIEEAASLIARRTGKGMDFLLVEFLDDVDALVEKIDSKKFAEKIAKNYCKRMLLDELTGDIDEFVCEIEREVEEIDEVLQEDLEASVYSATGTDMGVALHNIQERHDNVIKEHEKGVMECVDDYITECCGGDATSKEELLETLREESNLSLDDD